MLMFLFVGLIAGCVQDRQKALKSGQKSIILSGTVAPIEKVEVLAPVSAIVGQIVAQEGQRVGRGAVIVRLDPATLAIDVRRAEAVLDLARANLAQAESTSYEAQLAETQADVDRLEFEAERERSLATLPFMAADYHGATVVLDNARAKLNRLYSLYFRRYVSKPEVETAENEWAEADRKFETATVAFERRTAAGDSELRIAEARARAARARLRGLEAASRREPAAQARAQVREAEANLAQAQYNLVGAEVKAPIAGIVTSVKVHPGEKVYERSPLLTIEEINRVRIQAELSPGLLQYVRIGQPVQVTVNTVPPTTATSTVAGILPVADAKTQALGVTVILPNPDLKFQPGFTARVEIPIEGGTAPSPSAPPSAK